MFNDDARTIGQLKGRIQRVLIADPHPPSTAAVAGIMREKLGADIWPTASADEALTVAGEVAPDVIFVELSAAGFDGVAFTRALRRSDLTCRKTAVIAMSAQPQPAAVLAARDAGVHEFLRKPIAHKELLRRLEAAVLRPRVWVEGVDYVGPDRRDFNSGDYKGPHKRHSDQEGAAALAQPLKLLRSAAEAVERDPAQALRAMLAQTVELQACGVSADARLAAALMDLHGYLSETARVSGKLDASETQRRTAQVLAFAPQDGRAAA